MQQLEAPASLCSQQMSALHILSLMQLAHTSSRCSARRGNSQTVSGTNGSTTPGNIWWSESNVSHAAADLPREGQKIQRDISENPSACDGLDDSRLRAWLSAADTCMTECHFQFAESDSRLIAPAGLTLHPPAKLVWLRAKKDVKKSTSWAETHKQWRVHGNVQGETEQIQLTALSEMFTPEASRL